MAWIIQHPRNAASSYRIEPLAHTHVRAAFLCQEPKLTAYITGKDALRDAVAFNAAVYVCADAAGVVWGYFTLTNSAIARTAILDALHGVGCEQTLPRRQLQDLYRLFPQQNVGVTLLGKLAIHSELQGQGFGEVLLTVMLEAVWQGAKLTASKALILDAKNPRLIEYYTDFGFQSLPQTTSRMFMRMETIRDFVNA